MRNFVLVTLKSHNKANIQTFTESINKIDEIIECHQITGSGDFILRVVSKDIASYQKLMIEKVTDIIVVDNLQSSVILSTYKDSMAMPIPIPIQM